MDARPVNQIVETAAKLTAGGVVTPNGDGLVGEAMYSQAGMAGAARDVPIEPGQLDITANAVVVFELE